MENNTTPDVLVADAGTLWTINPLTGIAKQWITDNVNAEDYMWLGTTLCVEHRYIQAILEGMNEFGLTVAAR